MTLEKIGNASVLLGAGRIKKEDSIDFAAGITMHKKKQAITSKRGEHLHVLR